MALGVLLSLVVRGVYHLSYSIVTPLTLTYFYLYTNFISTMTAFSFCLMKTFYLLDRKPCQSFWTDSVRLSSWLVMSLIVGQLVPRALGIGMPNLHPHSSLLLTPHKIGIDIVTTPHVHHQLLHVYPFLGLSCFQEGLLEIGTFLCIQLYRVSALHLQRNFGRTRCKPPQMRRPIQCVFVDSIVPDDENNKISVNYKVFMRQAKPKTFYEDYLQIYFYLIYILSKIYRGCRDNDDHRVMAVIRVSAFLQKRSNECCYLMPHGPLGVGTPIEPPLCLCLCGCCAVKLFLRTISTRIYT